ELQALANTCLSLSPPQSKTSPRPPLSTFLECDKALAEILDLEAQWREICVELASGKAELEELIEEGDERIKAIEEAKKASIPYPELLAYAQSLSAFTSAPPNMPDLTLPGQPPPPLCAAGLNAEAPLGLLGETHSVGHPPTMSPKVDAGPNMPGANPYRQDLRPFLIVIWSSHFVSLYISMRRRIESMSCVPKMLLYVIKSVL
ncbi:hypothetical protein CPB84DRAFT_1765834, partial [Gymnopilus junonius]